MVLKRKLFIFMKSPVGGKRSSSFFFCFFVSSLCIINSSQSYFCASEWELFLKLTLMTFKQIFLRIVKPKDVTDCTFYWLGKFSVTVFPRPHLMYFKPKRNLSLNIFGYNFKSRSYKFIFNVSHHRIYNFFSCHIWQYTHTHICNIQKCF